MFPRRNPSETGKGPEPIGEVLARLFVARGWGRKSERQRLEAAWASAAGPEVAAQTRVLALKRGVLEVEVRSGVLLQELASFQKRKLMQAVQSNLNGQPIRDLRFRSAGR